MQEVSTASPPGGSTSLHAEVLRKLQSFGLVYLAEPDTLGLSRAIGIVWVKQQDQLLRVSGWGLKSWKMGSRPGSTVTQCAC